MLLMVGIGHSRIIADSGSKIDFDIPELPWFYPGVRVSALRFGEDDYARFADRR